MNIQKMKSEIFYYKHLILKIEKILCSYNAKDKGYLVSENNHLKHKCQDGEKILRKMNILTEENEAAVQNYFDKIKLGVLDLLLLLKWNNFGALKFKIDSIEEVKILIGE